jgi:penicillin-binding protein 1B
VGLDDYKDLKLDGATAAMPIWAEFMRRAHQHRAYRDVTQFAIPDGIVTAQIDNTTGQLATGACPQTDVHTEYYLTGTAPTQYCPLHAGGTEVGSWQESVPSVPAGGLPPTAQAIQPSNLPQPAPDPTQPDKEKATGKKGLFDKLKHIFH